ncbi:DUF397 domain-containing protein [Streptomyces sp. NPDC004609]|uniref:DUF397 domain-containing protein n=1 Tax=Streptomyces sp. NPDC004609 TaxID=3364704 RepID=UPI0036C5F9F2
MTFANLDQIDCGLRWFTSSYSSGAGGECVEVAMAWHKSSHSTGAGGECLEVATCPHAIYVRDSKDTTRRGLTVSPVAWTSFISLTRQ